MIILLRIFIFCQKIERAEIFLLVFPNWQLIWNSHVIPIHVMYLFCKNIPLFQNELFEKSSNIVLIFSAYVTAINTDHCSKLCFILSLTKYYEIEKSHLSPSSISKSLNWLYNNIKLHVSVTICYESPLITSHTWRINRFLII